MNPTNQTSTTLQCSHKNVLSGDPEIHWENKHFIFLTFSYTSSSLSTGQGLGRHWPFRLFGAKYQNNVAFHFVKFKGNLSYFNNQPINTGQELISELPQQYALNVNMTDHSVCARDEHHESKACQVLIFVLTIPQKATCIALLVIWSVLFHCAYELLCF